MAGEAKSTDFMLATATVMIGPAASLFDLDPATHSIGLVKNFQMRTEPSFTELTQGVKNSLVYSVMTGNPTRLSCEVYEYTAKNMGYALGLNGASFAPNTVATTLSGAVNGAGSPTAVIPVTSATGLVAGDYLLIPYGSEDEVLVRKIVSIATLDVTVNKTISINLPSGAAVKKVHAISVGAKDNENFFGAKIVGRLANGTEVVALFPKIRMTGGFAMQFQTNDYGNLPFEMTCYDLVPTDPFYADFLTEQAKLFRA
jgi:hypothetical protein